jgi:hypothetical protein
VARGVENPIPAAIEMLRVLLVAALRATGPTGACDHPMAITRYRERGRADHADAMTPATILRTDLHIHRRMPADSSSG